MDDTNTTKENPIKLHLINLGFLLALTISLFEGTVQTVVFWIYLVFLGAMLSVVIASPDVRQKGLKSFVSISLQFVTVGAIIYALINPHSRLYTNYLLLALQVYQTFLTVYQKHIKKA